MAQSIKDMDDRQLGELIEAAARSSFSWAFEGAATIIDAVGAELLRRKSGREGRLRIG